MAEEAIVQQPPMFKPKKSVALSGTLVGNTCHVASSD
jgi:hypothetical protein